MHTRPPSSQEACYERGKDDGTKRDCDNHVLVQEGLFGPQEIGSMDATSIPMMSMSSLQRRTQLNLHAYLPG